MERRSLLVTAFMVATMATAMSAEQIAVVHIQRPMHRFMVARSEDGKTLATGEFWQTVQGDLVTMRFTCHFLDGSIDDETTTYRQQGTFRLVRDHHLQKGPFFTKPIDFTVEAATGIVINRTVEKNGKTHVDSKRMALPDDLANGMVGTLLLNVPRNKRPFRVGMLAPVGGGRLIPLLISPEKEQTIQLVGHSLKAAVFRVHPELGGIVSIIARLIGMQPKDVVVWILEGEEPAVLVVLGQLGGYGPLVSSDLIVDSFDQ